MAETWQKDWEQIVDLVKQGVSESQLQDMVKAFRTAHPEEAENALGPGGLFDSEAFQSLSQTQKSTIVKAQQATRDESLGAILDPEALAAGAAGAAGVGAAGMLKGAGALAGAIGGTAAKIGAAGAETAAITDIATGVTSKVQLSQGILSKIAKGIVSAWPLGPKMTGAAAVGAGIAGYGMVAGEDGGPTTSTTGQPLPVPQGTPGSVTQGGEQFGNNVRAGRGRQPDPGNQVNPMSAPPGFNILVVDNSGQLTGTPGALAVIAPTDLGIPMGQDIGQVQSAALTFDGSTELIDQFTQYVTSAGGPSQFGSQQQVHQAIFPKSANVDIKINAPVQVGKSLQDIYNPRARTVATPGGGSAIYAGGPEASRVSNPRPTLESTVPVPAGAEVNPRAFEAFGGRTNLEWASYYAKVHGVPLNILYGLVAHESGWNKDAVGDNGQSHGLAQIYQPVWGDQVSVAQSRDPRYALNWAARMLAERFAQYGDWKVAVAAHNSPVAAEYLAKNGKYQNEKSAKYVADIMNRANRSGLSDYLADEGLDTEIAGTGSGSGIEVSPFAAPDPAASRAYTRETYMNLLGRNPTEEEMKKEVERINTIARKAYDQQVRNALGQSSTDVDVNAQFEEQIRGSGEFAFHEETIETQAFTDYAAGIASMLQRGI
jgi:hypothetical protein